MRERRSKSLAACGAASIVALAAAAFYLTPMPSMLTLYPFANR